MIRRERQEVMKELPVVSRTIRYVELDNIAQKTYDDEISDFVKWYNEVLIDDSENTFETTTNMMGRLARMRHLVALAKVPATVEDVKTFTDETDRKLVIFVHHIDAGEIIARELQKLMDPTITTNEEKRIDKMPILQLKGGLDAQKKFEIQEAFNNSPRCLMVASMLAAGEGLNLQTGADCIMHERQWNPPNEEQCEGRFIRIGQLATAVNAGYMIAAGTVDDIVTEIVERKRIEFHNSMNKGEMPVWKESDITKAVVDQIMENAGKSKIKKLC